MYFWLIFDQFRKQQYKHTCARVEPLLVALHMATGCDQFNQTLLHLSLFSGDLMKIIKSFKMSVSVGSFTVFSFPPIDLHTGRTELIKQNPLIRQTSPFIIMFYCFKTN